MDIEAFIQALIFTALAVNAYFLKSLDARATRIEIQLAAVIQKIGGLHIDI